MDLEQMDLKQLRDLRGQVDRAIANYEDRRKREARAAAEDAARQHGFSLSDLTGDKPARGQRKGSAAEVKYANPDDASQTWSGRGRRPRWVLDMLEGGKSLEDLAV
ncbi:H-NS histone family protein [Paracoccus sp. Z118]|uniref:H-NS histone family protein n=1 Tax=Paracoccus sp. Z118 TaxID=2851017 RepID=UPI001C2BD9A2|nr:H-NS histone family protein [Paracoccus sp. Z118]MBV0891244.1 H-NS histone family protein [Paracoccus sp. Z118]